MKNFLEYVEAKKSESLEDISFFKKRKAGAEKISHQAQEKGGPSILTHWHFDAKNPEYKKVLEAIEDKKSKEYFLDQYRNCLKKLNKDSFEQKEFQSLSGELEVWGEAIARLF